MSGLAVSAFVALVVVIDPIGVAAIFAALTQRESDAYRVRMAFKGTLLAAGILVLFTVVGDALLATLGISLAIPLIAGPGAITSMLLLTGRGPDGFGTVMTGLGILLAALAVQFVIDGLQTVMA